MAELREGFLVRRWDQRVVVTVSVLKSKFSSWFQKEKKDADKQRKKALSVTPVECTEVTVATENNEDQDQELTGEAAVAYAKFFDEPDIQLNEGMTGDVIDSDDIVVGVGLVVNVAAGQE